MIRDSRTHARAVLILISGYCLAVSPLLAQVEPASPGVVDRTIDAINYRYRSGDTRINFLGTELAPGATGSAKVEAKTGYLQIEADFRGLRPAREFATEYLTYVLWAITPAGRAENLGEILLDDRGRGELEVTTQLQALGLIVTAEPYFSIVEPSNLVVLENAVRSDTRGTVDRVEAQFELLSRGAYVADGTTDPLAALLLVVDPKIPIHLYQARNAVRIARAAGAETWAPDAFQKSMDLLLDAEAFQAYEDPDARTVTTAARQAVQTAEDARLLALSRIEDDRLAQERREAAERETRARAEAEQEAQLRQQAEEALREADRLRREADALRAEAESQRREADSQRAAAQAQQAEAETQRMAAEAQRAEAERQRMEAETQRRRAEDAAAAAAAARQEALDQKSIAETEAARARREAEEADRLRAQAEQDRTQLRERLETQLNRVLETTNTVRGLIVNMSDVLFDTGQYTLKPLTRETLARISGILSMQPDLRIEVEGHTDDVGTDDYNQVLSERRAQAVRSYLVEQGIASGAITAIGLGEARPKADNQTAEGRQQNRRVELIVSGAALQ